MQPGIQFSTWFRYRATAERTQSGVLLLTQHACAKSSAELLLHLQPAEAIGDEATVFTGKWERSKVSLSRSLVWLTLERLGLQLKKVAPRD
jgi:recombination protein RecA